MTTEKSQIDPHADYFELMTNEREANMNRQGYKNMKRDFFMQQGLDPNVIDFDYAFDAGNEQNKDILPAVKKNEDGSVTEDLLLDINTREGMAWASASKVYYDAFYNKKDKPRVHPSSIAAMYTAEDVGPKTPEEFAQWGIEHIGWLNYHLPSLGIQATKLGFKAQSNPQAAHAFLHLLNTYGELPMFTWKGTKRFFNGVLQDPTTYVGLGTLGLGLLGKKFVNVGGKGALKTMLRAAVDPKAAAVYEGALYSGVDDFFRQKVAMEAGPDVEGGQDKYHYGRGAMAGAFGAGGAGALIGTGEIAKRVGPMAYRAVSDMVNSSAEAANERIKERSTGTTLHSNPVGPIADQIISRMGGGGGPPKRLTPLDEMGFYSKAQEALETINQDKGTGKQFLGQLANKFNVKQEELNWLGLEKFNNDNKITKQEMIETIKQNYVNIRERKLIEMPDKPDPDLVNKEISFNTSEITDSSEWQHTLDNYIYDFEKGEMKEDYNSEHIDPILSHMGYSTMDFIDNAAYPNQMLESDIFNSKAAVQAMKEGSFEFTDFEGNNIDMRSDIEEYFNLKAEEEYMQNPYVKGSDTMGIGYDIVGNDDLGYQVTAPDGRVVVGYDEGVTSMNEAQVRATTDAHDEGHLHYSLDPDDVPDFDPANPNDTTEIVGQPRHEYKLGGGSNYRELILSNDSFDMDPAHNEIMQLLDPGKTNYEVKNQLKNEIYVFRDVLKSLPNSEKINLVQNILDDPMFDPRFYELGKAFEGNSLGDTAGVNNSQLGPRIKRVVEGLINETKKKDYDELRSEMNDLRDYVFGNPKDNRLDLVGPANQFESTMMDLPKAFDMFWNQQEKAVSADRVEFNKKLSPYMINIGLGSPHRFTLGEEIQNKLNKAPVTHYSHLAPNDIGHVRVTDRIGPNGEKMLYVEEMQSDWSQRGRHNMPTERNLEKARKVADAKEFINQTRLQKFKQVDQAIDEFNNIAPERKVEAFNTFKDKIVKTFQRKFDDGTDLYEFDSKSWKGYMKDILDGGPSFMMNENMTTYLQSVKDKPPSVSEFITSVIDILDNDANFSFDNMVQEAVLNLGKRAKDQVQVAYNHGNMGDNTAQLLEEYLKTGRVGSGGIATLLNSVVPGINKLRIGKKYRGDTTAHLSSQGLSYKDLGDLVEYDMDIVAAGADALQDLAKGIDSKIFNDEDVDMQRLKEVQSFNQSKDTQKFEISRSRHGFIPRGPFVGKTQDVAELQIKTLVRRAIQEGKDFVVVSGPEDQINRWGERYRETFETHYGQTIPKMAEKVLKQLDKKAKPYKADIGDIGAVNQRDLPNMEKKLFLSRDKQMLVIPITEKMKQSVERGMSLFELGGMAAGGGGAAVVGSQMAGQQENEQPGI